MTDRKRVLIVGGVAGGASAAARLRRLDEQAEIILCERGEHVSFANCGLPYHIGGVIADRDDLLVADPQLLRDRLAIDVRTRHEVLTIDCTAREALIRDQVAAREYRQPYDALILAPGAEPVRPPIPGLEHERVRTLRNMADMDAIIRRVRDLPADGRVAVIGGGYIGLEMAENLRHRGLAVTLVELADQVMGPLDREMASLLHQELVASGVDLRLKTSVSRVEGNRDGLRLVLSDDATLDCALAILAIGVRPEVALAKQAGLTLGPRGGIAVDEHLRTSDPAIYAVGDAIEVRDLVSEQAALIPLAGPANRQGRIAADNICGRDRVYRATQGTAICKVFGLAVAMTGLCEKAARRANLPFQKVYLHAGSHAGYYPGASRLSLKLLFDPTNGRVLGGQAVGKDGVDKRIDVLAMAVRHRLSVHDLAEAELCYAPPYGSAKDPVNVAGMIAANVLSGDLALCHAEDLEAERAAGAWLLDVRTRDEFCAGALPGATNIPIDELRRRLAEVPHDRTVVITCASGQRSYVACRMLAGHGVRCRNLNGGMLTWRMMFPHPPGHGTRARVKPSTPSASEQPMATTPALTLDACGLQCPGPILKVKEAMERLTPGQILEVRSTDPGFAADMPAWCEATGNTLVELKTEDGVAKALIAKGAGYRPAAAACESRPAVVGGAMTIVCFSNDLDRMIAAFIIANGAVAMGLKPTLFFTFWGINVLRRDQPVAVPKTLIERMFGLMMPRGARKLALSKMHLLGMGKAMIVGIMKRHRVASLEELIASARASGVRLVVCSMSMNLMGIKREELMDGIEEGGVANYLGTATQGNVNLFI